MCVCASVRSCERECVCMCAMPFPHGLREKQAKYMYMWCAYSNSPIVRVEREQSEFFTNEECIVSSVFNGVQR